MKEHMLEAINNFLAKNMISDIVAKSYSVGDNELTIYYDDDKSMTFNGKFLYELSEYTKVMSTAHLLLYGELFKFYS